MLPKIPALGRLRALYAVHPEAIFDSTLASGMAAADNDDTEGFFALIFLELF